MLVHLSPWNTVQTSVKLSEPSRRRKRNESDGGLLDVQALFVTASKKGQHKRKQYSSEFAENLPFLTITSDHRISVIGRAKEQSYSELPSLQYSSRPGSVGSFFAASFEGKGTSNISEVTTNVPAIFDSKNDRVYALQHGNSRLCVWKPLDSSGPEAKNAVRMELAAPAISMSLLPLHKGVVYGSCTNGSLFVARISSTPEGVDSISVEYLPNNNSKVIQNYIGTFAEIPQNTTKVMGRKRKMSDAEGHTSVLFYQTFRDIEGVKLVRHEVQFERFASASTMIVGDSHKQQVASISLVSSSDEKLISAELLVSSPGSTPRVAVAYQVKHTSNNLINSYCALLSLASGDLAHNRLALPSNVKQFGLIAETLMVCATSESIILYDLEGGSAIQTQSLAEEISVSFHQWRMCTDAKLGTVALLFAKDGTLEVAFSTLLLDGSYDNALSRKLTLSTRLASSDSVPSGCTRMEEPPTPLMVNNLMHCGISDGKKRKMSPMHEVVQAALSSLDRSRLLVLGTQDHVEDFHFIDTYEECVATLLTAMKNSQTQYEEERNPQDDLSSNGHFGMNGSKTCINKVPKNGLNGSHPHSLSHVRALTPAVLPQAFIDGALEIVLKLLQSGAHVEDPKRGRRIALARLDARLILSRIVSTGKLSARQHYESTDDESKEESTMTNILRSIKLTNKRGRRCFTPVDMIHDTLQKCPDVSERLVVEMLCYMLRRSLAEDSAEVLLEERIAFVPRSVSKLAQKFFAFRSKLLKASNGDTKEALRSPELNRLSQKLVVAGTIFVLRRIMGYSQFNEAMLRVALQDNLKGSEAVILSRMLTEVLSSTTVDVISRYPPSVNVVKSTCQWISALCDTFSDELMEAKAKSGVSCLQALLNASKGVSKQTQAIISLNHSLRRFDSGIDKAAETKNATTVKLPSPEELPGYSVDRLVF